MPHQCKALVINCMDFRLSSAIHDFMVSQGLKNNYDHVSVAGAALFLANPKIEADRDFVMGQVDMSIKFHGISQVYLINHTDCGAYGGKKAFHSNEQMEKEWHKGDLKDAKKVILEKFSQLEVIMVLARLNDNRNIDFEVIKD